MHAQIQRTDGQWYSAEYSTFSISDEASKYRLTVSGYTGDAGDPMTAAQRSIFNADGRMFSTPDSDNDDCPCNCAVPRGGGWWYAWCTTSQLNNNQAVLWSTTHYDADVQNTRMLVKVIPSFTVQLLPSDGWILMQRKVSGGSVSFNQNWAAYRDGFGSVTGNDNYWLGLDKIHRLMQLSSANLRVEVCKLR